MKPETPLRLDATWEANGTGVTGRLVLTAPEPLADVHLDLDVPAGDSLTITDASVALTTGALSLDPVTHVERHLYRLAMGTRAEIAFDVAPSASVEHSIYVRALSPRSNGDIWGDEDAYFYHRGPTGLEPGYQVLDKDPRTAGLRAEEGMREATEPERTPIPTVIPKPPREVEQETPAPAAAAPAGTVVVTGRWMMYDQNDNYIPQYEQLVGLYDGLNNWLAWAYTDINGYYTFSAVNNPANGLYVTVRTQTGYNRSGGVDWIWVRNNGGSIFYTYTGTYFPPDGTFNMGEWNTPNASTNEKGYWAFRALQDTWRYIYFIDTSKYAGSIEIQWYPGSTDGTYWSVNMIHLADNDPASKDTVAHECGHNIMYNAYGGYFPTNDCPSPHYIELYGGTNCGWTEGWGDFLPLAVYNDPWYTFPSGASLNLETPTWGTPGWANGPEVEGRVAGTLWDIIDSANEGKDFYTDSVAGIWNTVWNANNDTFCQFWDSSRTLGPIKRSRDNDLYQNTITSCSTCVEDPWEPDDTCATGLLEGVPSTYTYEHCTDEDWQYHNVSRDWTYTWETDDLGYSGDTTLTLYASDCATQLAYNDDKSFGNWPLASRIIWTSDRNDRVNIAQREFASSYSAHRSYDISLSRVCNNPAAATNLSPPDNTSLCSSPTLSWTGYGRTYDVVIDGSVYCANIGTTSCATSGFSGWHWWYVTSKTDCGGISYSSAIWFYVAYAPTAMATSASDADPILDTGVNVSWPTPTSWNDNGLFSGNRGFRVYRNGFDVSGFLAATTLSFNDNSGIDNVAYTYCVVAYNGCGYSATYTCQVAMDAVAPKAGEASKTGFPMTATKGGGSTVNVSYTAASCATDHVIYRGLASGPLGGLSWSAAACGRGTSGSTSFDPGTPAPGSFAYFVIVGNNGALEGSYGKASSGAERPEATGLPGCDYPQALAGACP